LLEAVPALSYGDEHTENMLIQDDNLEALKALLPFYAGRSSASTPIHRSIRNRHFLTTTTTLNTQNG